MKSQLFASAAFVLLSAVPGALAAEEAKLQGAVAVTSFEDQLADFFDEEEVSEDEDNMDMDFWSGKSRKGCSRNLLVECEDARRAVRRGRKVRRFGYSGSFSSFRDVCRDACGLTIPHRHRYFRDFGKSDKDWRDFSGKSEKDDRDRRRRRRESDKDDRDYSGKSDKDDRDYSGKKSEKDDRDYSGKSEKDDRDSGDKGGKSDKPDFFYDEEASEDEDFILTDSGSKHHHHHFGKGTHRVIGSKSGHHVVWPKSDKEASEDEDFILTDSGSKHHHHHFGKGTHRVIGSKSGHRVVWPKSDKEASEDEDYDSVGDV